MGLKVADLIDADIIDFVDGKEYSERLFIVCLLVQILRELRKEGPEERSKPIQGFGGFSPF